MRSEFLLYVLDGWRPDARSLALELVWFSTGKDDFLLDTTKTTVGSVVRSRARMSALSRSWKSWTRARIKSASPR
jgi:hypothetical protein